jgi:predicted transcriptional regulator
MPELSTEEVPVFYEVFYQGEGTVEEITARLARQGAQHTAEEVEAALKSLRKKGWVERSRWQWHLTAHAIQYMR